MPLAVDRFLDPKIVGMADPLEWGDRSGESQGWSECFVTVSVNLLQIMPDWNLVTVWLLSLLEGGFRPRGRPQ